MGHTYRWGQSLAEAATEQEARQVIRRIIRALKDGETVLDLNDPEKATD